MSVDSCIPIRPPKAEDFRCQSCGMPLGEFGKNKVNFGTNKDGSFNQEYCRMCYLNGDFTNPNLTLGEMISLSVHYMTKNLGFTQDKAREMSAAVIPNLKRWKVCGIGDGE